jgi:hemerythrin
LIFSSYFLHDRDFPTFGQLGCSGYIITDPTGAVLFPKTPAWLQHRDDSLVWMQRTLRSLMLPPGPAIPPATSAHQTALLCQGPSCAQSADASSDTEMDDDGQHGAVGSMGSSGRDADEHSDARGDDGSDDRSSAGGAGSDADCDARSGGRSAEGGGDAGAPAVRFEVPEALHVGPVDREHRVCARRLNALAIRRDAPALARALAALAAHFAHEERLLRAGPVAGRAIAAHAADHAAILALARAELRRCRGPAGEPGPARAVEREFLETLAGRFAFHTREYDARCADALRAAAGAEPAAAGGGGGG